MSRILPIRSGLDDRYINQTDVITENALEEVINNQGHSGGGLGGVIIIEPNFPTSKMGKGVAVNSEGAWTAQEVCGYLNITQGELDALFSGEEQIVYKTYQVTNNYTKVITGDPSAYNPTYETTETQTGQQTFTDPISFGYAEGYDPQGNLGVPGLKMVSFGLDGDYLNLYKLNNKYGTLYSVNIIA